MKNIPFLNSLYTKHDAGVLLDKLERLEESLYNVKLPFATAVKNVFSFAATEEFMGNIASANVSTDSPDALRKYLDTVKDDLQNLPTASIRVPTTPTDDTIKYISRWFDANMGQRVILDFVVEPTLIGGVVIEYNGKYADYSLKKVINTRFANPKQTLNN